jgi:hypothetical protein
MNTYRFLILAKDWTELSKVFSTDSEVFPLSTDEVFQLIAKFGPALISKVKDEAVSEEDHEPYDFVLEFDHNH